MNRFSNFLVHSALYRGYYSVTSQLVLPGFEGLSLYVVLRTLFREIRTHRLNVRGAAVTYNFIMAIPPTMLFLFSLVPYLPLQGVQDSINSILHAISPNENSYQSIAAVVNDFLHHERRDILSIGILFTLFFSSNGMMGLMRSFDRALPVYKARGGFRRRWTAIKLTVVLLVVAIVAIVALVLQTRAINGLLLRVFSNVIAIKLFSFLLMVTLIFLVICMIYKYGPSLTSRFHFFSAGAVFATFFCVFLTAVFFTLVNNVIHYNKVYGSIGTLMAFMVWIYLNTQVILLGYELNVSILLAKLERDESERKRK